MFNIPEQPVVTVPAPPALPVAAPLIDNALQRNLVTDGLRILAAISAGGLPAGLQAIQQYNVLTATATGWNRAMDSLPAPPQGFPMPSMPPFMGGR